MDETGMQGYLPKACRIELSGVATGPKQWPKLFILKRKDLEVSTGDKMMISTQIFLRVTPSQASQILMRYARKRRMGQSRMAPVDLWESESEWLAFQCTDLAGPPTTSGPGALRHAQGVAVSFYWMGEEGYTHETPADARPGVLYHVFQESLFSRKPRYQRSMLALGRSEPQLLLAGVMADPSACAKHWLRRDIKGVDIIPKRNWWPEWLRKKRAARYGLVWAHWLEKQAESLLDEHEFRTFVDEEKGSRLCIKH